MKRTTKKPPTMTTAAIPAAMTAQAIESAALGLRAQTAQAPRNRPSQSDHWS